MEKKLNIGCGTDIRAGWINLDISPIEGVDVVHDVRSVPLPFDDNSFDFILCQDILEHLKYISLIGDLHRILKPGGQHEIRVPHFSSKNNFVDPTHVKMFLVQTFDFFTSHATYARSYYFPFLFEKVNDHKIAFSKNRIFFINFLVEPIVNCSQRMRVFYEASFLSRLFPCANIIVRLQK